MTNKALMCVRACTRARACMCVCFPLLSDLYFNVYTISYLAVLLSLVDLLKLNPKYFIYIYIYIYIFLPNKLMSSAEARS